MYDADTRALIQNDQKVANRLSRMDLQKNEDGSVDIYCGPQAPAGFEKNWIATVPGKNWFAYFRFYQPTEAFFDRSWPLPDFEQIWTRTPDTFSGCGRCLNPALATRRCGHSR